MSRTRLLASSTNFAPQTTLDFQHPTTAISGTSPPPPFHQPHLCPFTALTSCAPFPLHSPFYFRSPHSANMADMDTYDNEPRTYDGMSYPYSPYANRRVLSYDDLVPFNNSSSDLPYRASEDDPTSILTRPELACDALAPVHLLTSNRVPARRRPFALSLSWRRPRWRHPHSRRLLQWPRRAVSSFNLPQPQTNVRLTIHQ